MESNTILLWSKADQQIRASFFWDADSKLSELCTSHDCECTVTDNSLIFWEWKENTNHFIQSLIGTVWIWLPNQLAILFWKLRMCNRLCEYWTVTFTVSWLCLHSHSPSTEWLGLFLHSHNSIADCDWTISSHDCYPTLDVHICPNIKKNIID